MIVTPRTVIENREYFISLMVQPETIWDCRHLWYSKDLESKDHDSFLCHSYPFPDGTDVEMRNSFIDGLRQAHIVIWEKEIYDIATHEAKTVFANRPLPDFFPLTTQVWFVKNKHHERSGDECRELAIDADRVIAPFFIQISITPQLLTTVCPFFSADHSRRLFIRYIHSGAVSTEKGEFVGDGSILGFQARCIAARLFLDTKAARVEETTSEPRVIKHWKKRNVCVPTIKTVLLREEERRGNVDRPDGQSSSPGWSHRWLVRPHWRMQRVGPQLSASKPAFIGLHVKGPADKPLIVKDTVFVAKR